MAFDLIIRGGTVVDGTGAPPVTADVAVDGDRIAEVGRVEGRARREIDADGLVVTPGFVDIHTHLDAQLAWDPLGTSASWHGVTSVVLGNCGVTFAPVAPGGQQVLAEMMESVEDIPASSILDGLSWNWETYGDYLDELDRLPKGLNVGGMVGHCAVRLAAMGERAMDETPAAAEDIGAMATMVDQALASGALGFSTSRTLLHKVPDGRYVPGTKASADELMAFADVLRHRGGIFEVAPAYVDIGNGSEDPVQDEVGLYADISRAADCDVSMALTQVDAAPDLHRNVLAAVDRENAAGARLRPQTTSRQIAILFGLAGRTPFDRWGSWQTLADLPLEGRVARLRDPASRAPLLADAERSVSDGRIDWTRIYPLSDRPVRHVFTPEDSVAAIAAQRRVPVAEAMLDLLVEMDGRRILTWPILNQDLDEVLDMLSRPHVTLGLADAGAHATLIMDASQPTFFLTHWVRDEGRFTLEDAVRRLTSEPADLFGVSDRGRLVPGGFADVNVIDLEGLALGYPEMAHDFPGGAPRWIQDADGYRQTLVNGEVFLESGQHTGVLAGRTVRL